MLILLDVDDGSATLSLFDTRANLIASRRLFEQGATSISTFSEHGFFFVADNFLYSLPGYSGDLSRMAEIGSEVARSLTFIVAAPGPVVWGSASSIGSQETMLVCVQPGSVQRVQ
jgi:hypothetical protein